MPEIGLSIIQEFDHSREAVARSSGVKEEEVVSCQESEFSLAFFPFRAARNLVFSLFAFAALSWVCEAGTEIITNGIRQGASPKRKNGEPLGPKARYDVLSLSLRPPVLHSSYC